MSIMSFASTSQGISIVHTTGQRSNFSILHHIRIVAVPGELVGLAKAIESVVQSRHRATKIGRWVVVKVGSGMYAASPDTYKAEGIVEYVLGTQGFSAEYVSKQALAKGLGCAKKEKWQDKAESLFNSGRSIKGFSQGFDAACAGAWSLAS